MRYYNYVSEAKVDMLFGQIPPRLLSGLATELKVDLQVVGLTVQKGPADTGLYGRLDIVEAYLDRDHDISWMSEPSAWFRGECELRMSGFGPAPDGPLLMMGREAGTVVALIGSAHHLFGRRVPPESGLMGHSMLPSLFRLLQEGAADRPVTAPAGPPRGESARSKEGTLREVARLDRALRGPGEPSEFLARRLLSGVITDDQGQELNVVVGTPLYVAQTDE
ncbi:MULTISPECIES: DUF7019 family protein [unclassified Streptomyces]|uniref:DUF7019 family protein n=1 Tax=unclassified Streptomyces TaxID=2593676 RepID=UPI00074B30B8|nr:MULTISPECIES: SAVMC3_10250 family protein [unclassified Streptomyces]KUL74972.1 hypothetical protein ADL34_16195 [Streptomyces sp. NRRL WC-3605]KUL77313.1 hypothetical protein ADL33_09745 [Streptomyces sp. NRRL WC-3604]